MSSESAGFTEITELSFLNLEELDQKLRNLIIDQNQQVQHFSVFSKNGGCTHTVWIRHCPNHRAVLIKMNVMFATPLQGRKLAVRSPEMTAKGRYNKFLVTPMPDGRNCLVLELTFQRQRRGRSNLDLDHLLDADPVPQDQTAEQ